MRKSIVGLLYFLCNLSGVSLEPQLEPQDAVWAKEISTRVDTDAKEWLKQQLKAEKLANGILETPLDEHLKVSKCHNCVTGSTKEDTSSNLLVLDTSSNLLVFMSFSAPDSTWLKLSCELEQIDGIFVIRGLPENSFKALSAKILTLKEKGVNAIIQIDPKRFKQYRVEQVPCFLVAEESTFDKVSGNISLVYALDLMAEKGETKAAKSLRIKLKGAPNAL